MCSFVVCQGKRRLDGTFELDARAGQQQQPAEAEGEDAGADAEADYEQVADGAGDGGLVQSPQLDTRTAAQPQSQPQPQTQTQVQIQAVPAVAVDSKKPQTPATAQTREERDKQNKELAERLAAVGLEMPLPTSTVVIQNIAAEELAQANAISDDGKAATGADGQPIKALPMSLEQAILRGKAPLSTHFSSRAGPKSPDPSARQALGQKR